jgi:GNAT superfamily N-acetyltransferase
MSYEIREGELLISDDSTLLDRAMIHQFLSEESYWACGLPRDVMDRSLDNSLCFGIYDAGRQVGFARAVTDFATFAWLADVFVVESERGQGVARRLIAGVCSHPRLQGLRRFILATIDAHGLYAQYGFAALKNPERFMEIHRPNVYKDAAKP